MDTAFPDRLRKCANDMRAEGIAGSAAAGAPMAMEVAADEIALLDKRARRAMQMINDNAALAAFECLAGHFDDKL